MPGRRRLLEGLAGAVLGASAAGSAGAVPAGRVEDRRIVSKALGRSLACTIYRPAVAATTRLPLLLLLHGLGGTARDWVNDGRIVPALDGLIAAGEIPPLLVAMPEGDSGWYVDSNALGGPGDWESAIARDLLDGLEAALPIAPAPRRAVAGLSMGGYGALRLAFAEPGRWAAVAALSPAIWQNVPAAQLRLPPEQLKLLSESAYFHQLDAATVVGGISLPPPGRHFSGAFGTPFDPRRYNELNPFTLLSRALARGLDPPPVYVAVGDDDAMHLERGAIALYNTLRAQLRPVELRIADGGHDWAFWSEAAPDMLRFLGRHLGPGDPS